MDRRGWFRVAAALVLAIGLLAVSSVPAAAQPGRVGRAASSWAVPGQHGDGLVARLGAWLVQVAKVLTGETDGDTTNIGGGIDPTNSGEVNTDPAPGVLPGLPLSGS
jgi:hypothetical protein